jgi:dolichol-phosphate mannosyltransferase
MPKLQYYLLSIVVPVYNESTGLFKFHASLIEILRHAGVKDYEIIYCDDGSTDNTAELISGWHATDPQIKLISFSRNFGKEIALSAGIAMAQGQAILMLDGDGQHPVELIPEFINAWKNGAQVVIGLRTTNDIGWVKRLTTRLFYKLFNKLADQKLIIGSTDFRLIDRKVQQVFLTLPEADRITRGLIDWLGFRRQYIKFAAKKRESGLPGYNLNKLMGLAANSFTSLTLKPLFLFGYLGVLITVASFLLGIVVFIEQPLLGDPWHWKFTGTAMLGILILFLVGIVLMSQGIMSLYVSRIYRQSRQRPLYVVDYDKSIGIEKKIIHQ